MESLLGDSQIHDDDVRQDFGHKVEQLLSVKLAGGVDDCVIRESLFYQLRPLWRIIDNQNTQRRNRRGAWPACLRLASWTSDGSECVVNLEPEF